MYNFDPCSVLLSIATNIAVLLMTASVLQGHLCISKFLNIIRIQNNCFLCEYILNCNLFM